MGRKKHTAEEIVAKLRQVDVLVLQGRKVAEAIRSIEVTEVTYYHPNRSSSSRCERPDPHAGRYGWLHLAAPSSDSRRPA